MKTLFKLMDIKALVAGVFPVALGSVYSYYRFAKFGFWHMCLLGIGIVLLQLCGNILNKYSYHVHLKNSTENKTTLANFGGLSVKQIMTFVLILLLADGIIGLYYFIRDGWIIVIVGALGTLIMYFYSAGDRPISHTPFAEFVAGSVMGFGIMATVIYVQSGVMDLETVIVALPTSIYIGTILLTNNICDYHEDKKIGKITLPVQIGVNLAELIWLISCHSLLTFTAAFVFVGYWPVESLLLVIVLFPYVPIFRFRSIPKTHENKVMLMELVGRIGLRYHVAVIAGIMIAEKYRGGLEWIFR